jgi:hypothetical protein
MVAVANELRAAHSPSFIVEQLCEADLPDRRPAGHICPGRICALTGHSCPQTAHAVWIWCESVPYCTGGTGERR